MKESKKQILEDLNNIVIQYQNSMIKIIKNDKALHTKTVMINTILQRSLSIIDAYQRLLTSNNVLILNSLMRLQIDNCIFIYGMYLLCNDGNDIAEIYKDIFINRRRLFEYKINKKEKLYDKFIIERINNDIPNFKELYEFCCRFIHYSDTASYLTMEAKEELIIEFNLSTNYRRFKKQTIINGNSFVEVSKLVLIMISKYWNNIDLGKPLI